ncbi:sensor histidine kinase [Paludibacterium purpuratum]|uniref:Histidine kinase/DNA gyrase B/HSP90-like ATPase n=1 Tax=Paludibacterium purpuratum TaxID=1144873 RepID=A0A4R7BFF6_9NEIS|nr:ATP-binding protein [Paludibacterium purpuratum]TDR82785.1 histidine kinase/DNA gyrase B/HSP90-like ATPase [Paludibacterium purpuratum]
MPPPQVLTDHAAADTGTQEALAQLLHDDLAQLLAFALIQLDTARATDPAGSGAAFEHGRQLVKQALHSTRGLIDGLRSAETPPPAELGQQCRQLAQEIGRLSRRKIVLDCQAIDIQPPPPAQRLICRAARELLINACKHAPRADIRISLRAADAWPGGLVLTVSDNGPGIDPARMRRPAAGHHGLCRLPDQLAQAGAQLELHSRPGHGVQAHIHWQPSTAGSEGAV